MISLKPVMLETSWAGDRLKKIRNYDETNIGIVREVCAYKNSQNEVNNKEYSGKLISDVIEESFDEVMGDDNTDQLIRVAYIDAKDQLSVQVHPNQLLAEKENDYEKTESWYVVDCEPDAYVIAGSKTNDKKMFEESIKDNSIENLLQKVKVNKGDIITIPAGLVHACGKDMLVIEAGSFGGITYRLYDYGSNRPLHLEKGLEALDLDLKPEISRRDNQSHQKVSTHLYVMEVINLTPDKSYKLDSNNKYRIIINVEGEVKVSTKYEARQLDYTETILLPASTGKYLLEGSGKVLLCYRP